MKVSDLNPHIRYARVHRVNFYSKKEFSKCYDCRIFFFDNVTGHIIVNEKKYNILNKTAAYFPPATEYKFNIDFNENSSVIVVDFDLVNQYAENKSPLGTATKDNFNQSLMPVYTLLPELSQPLIVLLPHLDRLLMQCADNFILKEPFYRESSSALLKLCLLEFIKQSKKFARSKLCESVLAYIHKNYAAPALTNEYIAKEFNYHPYHLSRMIKNETGQTLHKYLVFYRLQIAKNLLLTTHMDISEIAWKSGFCTSAYFIKTFHENIGMTPKEYRRLQLHTEI